MLLEVKNEDALGLAEINQSINIRLAFANYFPEEKRVVRLHEWVKCRDFLGDVIHANFYEKEHSIYRFVSSAERIPIDKQNTVLLLKHSGTTNKFKKNISKILHSFEEKEGLSLSKFVHFKGHTIIIGDSKWQSSIAMISLYTLLLRCACHKLNNPEDWVKEIMEEPYRYENTDRKYIISIWPTINKCIGNIVEIFTGEGVSGWPNEQTTSISILHNVSGITSIIQGDGVETNLYYKKLNTFLGTL